MWPTNYLTYTGANCTGTKNNTDVFGGKGPVAAPSVLRLSECCVLRQRLPGLSDHHAAGYRHVERGQERRLYCPTGMTCGGGGMSATRSLLTFRHVRHQRGRAQPLQDRLIAMAPPSAGIDPGRRLVFSPDWENNASFSTPAW